MLSVSSSLRRISSKASVSRGLRPSAPYKVHRGHSRSLATAVAEESVLSGSTRFLDILKDSIIPIQGHKSAINVPQFVYAVPRAEVLRKRELGKQDSLNASIKRGRKIRPSW